MTASRIDYTQLKAPISRKALLLSTKLLNAYIEGSVNRGEINEEGAEAIKELTVYELHQAIEEGQREIWIQHQEEEYKRNHG